MPKNRRLFICLSIILLGTVTILLAPLTVSCGLRLWIWWEARGQGLSVELGEIDAPFLRPVILHRLRIASARNAAWRAELRVAQAIVDLNLTTILTGATGRDIRSLSIEGLRAEIHHTAGGDTRSQFDWTTLQKLLPSRFQVTGFDLRIENDAGLVLLRNASFSASEIEAGRCDAREFTIASPWFRQTFSNLRGATKWQDNRLTLGGIALSHGLDLQSMAADLSHLSRQRADLQFDLDAFGGKIRASISNEWRSGHSNWNIAGAASDISLAQTSEAIGFTDRLGGSLHACKFTFRGDPHDVTHATASIWTELAGLSWHNRTAEVIMLGAVLYNRQIQLQQFYVKQHENQFTLSGEGSLQLKPPDWLSPDFRGDISGAISDLGDFASLFGAEPGDFAGKIAVNGTMGTRNRKIGGHLTATGNSLSIFKTQIDNFTANLSLKGSQLEIEQIDVSRKQDWLHAEGRIDLGTVHNYSGSLSADLSNLSDYLQIFGATDPADSSPVSARMQFAIDSNVWSGVATVTTAHSQPIVFGAVSLPIWIGEDWSQFSMRPLHISLGCSSLSLDESLRWLGLGIFHSGILSGAVDISGTLQRPNINGEMQLIDAKTNNERLGFDEISGRARFSGSHGLIDFLRVANKAANLSFSGDLDATNIDNVTITLSSNLPMFDATSYPLSCVSRMTAAPMETALAPPISGIVFCGGLVTDNWTITLQPTAHELLEPTPIAARTIPFCLGAWPDGKTLTLGVYSPPPSPVAKPRKRTKHH